MDIIKLKSKLTSLAEGEVAVVYLGGAGFSLSAGGHTLLCDPYLSDSVDRALKKPEWTRLYAPPFSPQELSFVDAVCVSHDHLDHADPDTIAPMSAARRGIKFVCGRSIAEKVREYGAENVVPLSCGVRYVLDGVTVTAIPAAHEQVKLDSHGDPEACGFIFDFGGVRVYHSGDSLVYRSLPERVANVDVMLLPVNGNGFFRRADDIVGNMDAYDAARLAALCRTRLLVPMHFDLYRGNFVPAEAVKAIISAAAPTLRFELPVPGEGWRVSADGIDTL